MLVSRAFLEAFGLVHVTFQTAPAEVEEAKAIARADMPAAERAYFSAAAMIRAGWRPLDEQASAFIARTHYVDPKETA